jgi:hypothetical protein
MTTPSDAITIRVGYNGNYQDVCDAAAFHAKKCGGLANALACMAQESDMYAEWRRATPKRLPPLPASEAGDSPVASP